MTKRMLIDATHAEETRVVVLDGNRLEDFDVETATKKQLKGNIYLAKVVRVEPSLQAAFVEYGGNRHGFLAFGEIHPDYYQIPVADRQRLLEMQEQEAREEEEEEERAAARASPPRPARPRRRRRAGRRARPRRSMPPPKPPFSPPRTARTAATARRAEDAGGGRVRRAAARRPKTRRRPRSRPRRSRARRPRSGTPRKPSPTKTCWSAAAPRLPRSRPNGSSASPCPRRRRWARRHDGSAGRRDGRRSRARSGRASCRNRKPRPGSPHPRGGDGEADAPAAPPETIGGEAEERPERRPPPRFLRNYKIQEVIRRRQILLVQVVKEERGTKGAALTTYISLAGRFSVLMPNSPRGGGISRKITSAADRQRLQEVITELDLPRGMGLIVRTAGANRPKPEIKRDCEYLLRLWDDIRERTMQSIAPALIYEEASLIKRAIRDVYSRDVDEVLVDGEEGWRAARDFMRMLMPTHAAQGAALARRRAAALRQGAGRGAARRDAVARPCSSAPAATWSSTRPRRWSRSTSTPAARRASAASRRRRSAPTSKPPTRSARQLRLRDLAGLIVIDFIDMESRASTTRWSRGASRRR